MKTYGGGGDPNFNAMISHGRTGGRLDESPASRVVAVNLLPGRVLVEKDRPIKTLLGSCVAVCLFDPKQGLMGMNHFLLPHVNRDISDVDANLSGMASMEFLVNAMLKLGSSKNSLRAKAFGGATMLHANSERSPGTRNITFTREWLDAENIPLVAMEFGGHCARRIVGSPQTGVVHCWRIEPEKDQKKKVVQTEQDYERGLLIALSKRHVDFL